MLIAAAAVPCFLRQDDNADDVVQLDEWLDSLPEGIKDKLHSHANAESWRRLAFGRGFTDP